MKNCKFKLMLLAFLAGCTPEVASWTPAENPKVNKIERVVFTHTIHYPAHATKMEAREKKNLLKFLHLNAPSPSAVNVTLFENGGYSEKRIKDIKREFIRYGISLDAIEVETEEYDHKTKDKKVASYVEVVIEQYLVIPPSCGDFSQPIGNAEQSQPMSNYGCADTSNLGMMVANPRDLIKGRSMGSSDGTVISAGVDRYRKNNITPLIDTSTTASTTGSTPTAAPSAGVTSSGGTQ